MNRKQVADKIDRQLAEIDRYERDRVDLPAGAFRAISAILRNEKPR